MEKRQQAGKLIDLFNKLWEEKYGRRYIGNRHADQWGFVDMIDDVGLADAKTLIEYYFQLSHPGHERRWLIYNYDKVLETKMAVDADKAHRRMLMEQTKRMMEEE